VLPKDSPLFSRIFSAYVLHEFSLSVKVALLVRLAQRLSSDGILVVGDIAFPDPEQRDQAHRRWKEAWDED